MGKAKRKIIFGETGTIKRRFPEPVEFRGAVTGRLYFTHKPGQALIMDKRDAEAVAVAPENNGGDGE